MGRGSVVPVLACVAAVVAVSGVVHLERWNVREEVAPVLTAAGVAGASVIYFLKEAADKRRKTLETFERLLYDRDPRIAWSSVRTAIDRGTFEADSAEEAVGSHRDRTSLLVNYLDVTGAGVRKGLYDRALFREFMKPLVQTLIESFLVRPSDGNLPSELFLEHRAELPNIEAVFRDLFAAAAKRPSSYRACEAGDIDSQG